MPGLTGAFRAQAVHAGSDPLPGIGLAPFREITRIGFRPGTKRVRASRYKLP